jgi:hypothetical protein
MANPLEEFLSELFSIKGIVSMIVIALMVFVLFTVTGALKQVDPNNQELNETITDLEDNTASGISWFLLITGVVGTITLVILGIKAALWILEELGLNTPSL